MTFYSDITSMITDITTGDMFGDATLTRVNQHTGTFSRATGKITPSGATTSVVACRAVKGKDTITENNGVREVTALVTLTAAPETDDLITIGASTYTVLEVITIAPVGTALLYKALVKA